MNLKQILPKRLRGVRGRINSARGRPEFRGLGVEQTFERVYSEGWWGDGADFDSGDGSVETVAGTYVETIRGFVAEHGIGSIVDVGCGDFRVGSQLQAPGLRYLGVDVVESLIERNRKLHEDDRIGFACLNVIRERPPQAELALVRQVLQHLSNDEIASVLENVSHMPYLIVTEHIPVGEGVVPNRDMPHGPDIRLQARSGVFLDQPPFSRSTRTLCEVEVGPGEALRTMLVEPP
jgi:hypothetical protein